MKFERKSDKKQLTMVSANETGYEGFDADGVIHYVPTADAKLTFGFRELDTVQAASFSGNAVDRALKGFKGSN